MPDFSSKPLTTDEELNEWLTFHELLAPLSVVGTFVTKDPVSKSPFLITIYEKLKKII